MESHERIRLGELSVGDGARFLLVSDIACGTTFSHDETNAKHATSNMQCYGVVKLLQSET